LYICGPRGFIDWVRGTAMASGWSTGQVHTEYFSALPIEGNSFMVIAQRSGAIVRVEADQSIATALRQAGIDVPLSCEAGVCGTCLVEVLEGVPDHRDCYQTDDEKLLNNRIACCCSRARTPSLVLEL
jgi:vanillate monooxygenase ferredoxin subunit